MKTVSFIGGGRITRILLQGFKNANIVFDSVMVFDINADTLNNLKIKYSNISITNNLAEIAGSELVILAVHPPVVMESLQKIKESLKPGVVILSLAPKFNIEKLKSELNGIANIARMNPSASCIVNKGMNPISFAQSFEKSKKSDLIKLLQPLGETPEVDDAKIEAYAVISAMGHTYYNFQLQKLKELAVSFGMDKKEAETTISNMLRGTAETLFNSGLPYEDVANLVPVKPLGEVEETIKGYYEQNLTAIFNKIKP
jgi:pyrroline-5-carboxylate reductase